LFKSPVQPLHTEVEASEPELIEVGSV